MGKHSSELPAFEPASWRYWPNYFLKFPYISSTYYFPDDPSVMGNASVSYPVRRSWFAQRERRMLWSQTSGECNANCITFAVPAIFIEP